MEIHEKDLRDVKHVGTKQTRRKKTLEMIIFSVIVGVVLLSIGGFTYHTIQKSYLAECEEYGEECSNFISDSFDDEDDYMDSSDDIEKVSFEEYTGISYSSWLTNPFTWGLGDYDPKVEFERDEVGELTEEEKEDILFFPEYRDKKRENNE